MSVAGTPVLSGMSVAGTPVWLGMSVAGTPVLSGMSVVGVRVWLGMSVAGTPVLSRGSAEPSDASSSIVVEWTEPVFGKSDPATVTTGRAWASARPRSCEPAAGCSPTATAPIRQQAR